jgi:hypothetical protein
MPSYRDLVAAAYTTGVWDGRLSQADGEFVAGRVVTEARMVRGPGRAAAIEAAGQVAGLLGRRRDRRVLGLELWTGAFEAFAATGWSKTGQAGETSEALTAGWAAANVYARTIGLVVWADRPVDRPVDSRVVAAVLGVLITVEVEPQGTATPVDGLTAAQVVAGRIGEGFLQLSRELAVLRRKSTGEGNNDE